MKRNLLRTPVSFTLVYELFYVIQQECKHSILVRELRTDFFNKSIVNRSQYLEKG